MKALIVKEDGLIWAADLPEEPILCDDQEKANRMLKAKWFVFVDDSPSNIPGTYQMPDLDWEVKESSYPCGKRKVVVLKESTEQAKMITVDEMADEAFKREMECNVSLWNITLDEEEAKYWKEVWKKGYNAASQKDLLKGETD